MEPVELDFMYGGNTQTEGAKIVKTTEQIASAHADATKMIARHDATVLELPKDLVALGTAYKQATSKQQKSEILTEIELTKENILDSTAATKQLKTEIASMNKMPKSAAMPDANTAGKAAVGYSSLSFSTQQLVRELPAATMGLNMFFLAISNNIPVLTDGIKRARAENEALKNSNQTGVPVWKQLVSSLFSWQSAMMVGITVLSMYGKDIAAFVSKLFTSKEAIDKTAESQKALNKVFSDFTGNAARKIEDVVKMGIEIETYGNKAENSRTIIENFNKTFNTHFTTIEQVRAAYPKLSEAAITAAVKIQAANSLIEKSAQAVLKKQEADTALSPYSAKQVKEQEAQLNKLMSIAKKYGADLNEITSSLISGEGFGAKGISNVVGGSSFATGKMAGGDVKQLMELKDFYSDENNLWFAKYLAQQRKYSKLIGVENKEIGKLLADVEYKDFSPTTTPTTPDKKTPTVFGQTPDAQVGELLLSINKGINNKLAKQRKDFITKNQQAEKQGREQEFNELKKTRDEANRIIQQTGDERTRIEKEYDERIKTLRKDGRFDAIAEVEKERDEKISKATKGMIEESELYKTASDDKLNIAKETTQALLEELKKRIEAEVAAGKMSVEEGNKLLQNVGKAQATAQGDKNKNNPFAQLGDAISGNTSAQKAYDAAKADKNTPVAKLAELEDAANKSRKSMASAAAESLNGVNAILGSVVGGLDQLGLLNEQQKKDAENIMGMISGAANLATGIATGNPVAIVQGSVELLVNAIEFFDFENKKLEKSQREHMKNVQDLELKYKKLQRAVETALGTDVYKAQRSEIENQKKQISEYEAWLALEMQKKKRKQDADKIAETRSKIDELKNSIADEAKAITEAIAQTDAKSLAGELADAITTAFANGEDAALAFGDVAEKVMANAVKNALKLQFLEKPMQNAVDQLAKDMESGGALSDSEQAAFRDKIENAGKLYYEQLAQYSDLFAGDAAGANQSGIKGDVAKMTEETGSALVGQITAMRLNVSALLANSKSSLDTVGKVLATLELIKTNTDRLNRIDETLYYLKLNGIKVL